MANELKIQMYFSYTKGNDKIPANPEAFSVDVAGTLPVRIAQNVGTAEETMDISVVGTAGWVKLKNLSAANFVQWGVATGVYTGKLAAGGKGVAQFMIDPGVTTLYWKANTAACDVIAEVLPA